MATRINLSDDARIFCTNILQNMTELCEDIYGIILSSIDGHPILEVSRKTLSTNKLSAMSSSLMALGETISKEAQQNTCQYVIVENADGKVICLRTGSNLTLSVFSEQNANMGLVLSVGKQSSEKISAALKHK